MKLKVLFVAIAMAIVSALTSQAQTQADIDNAMSQVASQMNQELKGQEGIQGVTYDKATHGIYINLDNTLMSLAEAESLPRTAIKQYILEGMTEGGNGAEFGQILGMLGQLNVKLGIRYTYKGKRYTDLFYPSDF